MNTTRLSAVAIAIALLGGIFAGCGSDDEGGTSSQTASAPAATPTTASTPAATTEPTEPAKPAPDAPIADKPGGSPAGNIGVPDLVGQDLSSAQAALKSAGLVFTAQAKSGDRAAIRNSWEVCQTIPAAGRKVPGDSGITVIAAPPGGC